MGRPNVENDNVLWDIARDSSPPTPTEYFPAETPTPGDTEACYLFHVSVNWFATDALQKGVLLWKVRPKTHQLDHLVLDQARRCNPLWVASYSDEDYVGKVKTMAVRAVPNGLCFQVLQRYCAFVCIRWRRELLS